MCTEMIKSRWKRWPNTIKFYFHRALVFLPKRALCRHLVREYAPSKSILGICLGHQGIGEVFGGQLENMSDVLHGISDQNIVTDTSERLFKGLPGEFKVGRYHSWTVIPETVPETMTITAVDEQGRVMGLAA